MPAILLIHISFLWFNSLTSKFRCNINFAITMDNECSLRERKEIICICRRCHLLAGCHSWKTFLICPQCHGKMEMWVIFSHDCCIHIFYFHICFSSIIQTWWRYYGSTAPGHKVPQWRDLSWKKLNFIQRLLKIPIDLEIEWIKCSVFLWKNEIWCFDEYNNINDSSTI